MNEDNQIEITQKMRESVQVYGAGELKSGFEFLGHNFGRGFYVELDRKGQTVKFVKYVGAKKSEEITMTIADFELIRELTSKSK